MEKKGGTSKTKKKFVSKHEQEKINAQIAEQEKPKNFTVLEINGMKEHPPVELGQGTFAIVYRGSHQGTAVAIKEYKSAAPYSNIYYKAEKDFFVPEGKVQPLRDSKIVRLFGYNDEGHTLVFEFAPKNLSSRIRDLDWETSLKILQQTAEALSLLHDQSRVYCDLKPANILLTEDDDIKLIDFNVVVNVGKPSQVNTAGYAAPEMTRNGGYEKMNED